MLTAQPPYVIINTERNEREVHITMTNNYFDTLNWTHINTLSEMAITVEEYIDDSRTFLKQVWNDGFVEIHKIGG